MDNLDKKEYTWYPENSDRFYNTYDSTEECIKAAKREYNTRTGDFYGCDGRYSPVINIGIVEHVNYDKLVDICYDGIQDNVHDYVDEFAFGTDFETECYFNENEENDIKLKLKEIIHSLFINPIKRASVFKMKYDLNKNGWIDE